MEQGYDSQLLIGRFSDVEMAAKAANGLKTAAKEKGADTSNIAVVKRTAEDKIEFHESGDVDGKKGAKVGAAVGAAIGLIGGPLGIVAAGAVGAAVGGLAGKFIDSGIDNKKLEELGKALSVGSSAVVIVTTPQFAPLAEQILQSAGAAVESTGIKNMIMARTDEVTVTGTLPGPIN
jgi:uncharacterized membrane protein